MHCLKIIRLLNKSVLMRLINSLAANYVTRFKYCLVVTQDESRITNNTQHPLVTICLWMNESASTRKSLARDVKSHTGRKWDPRKRHVNIRLISDRLTDSSLEPRLARVRNCHVGTQCLPLAHNAFRWHRLR